MAYKNKELRRATVKAYREANKEKIMAYNEANKERIIAYTRAYREANKEKIVAWNKANKERIIAYQKAWREANTESRLAAGKAWRKANPDICNAHNAKHRARKLKLIPDIVLGCPIEKKRVDDIYKLCVLISKVTGVKHHVDHMWPLSKDGPEWSGNMQIIPAKENLSKRAKLCPEIKRNIKQSLKELENVFQ